MVLFLLFLLVFIKNYAIILAYVKVFQKIFTLVLILGLAYAGYRYPEWFIKQYEHAKGVATVLVDKIDKPYGLHVDGNMLFITCQGSNSVFRQKIAR